MQIKISDIIIKPDRHRNVPKQEDIESLSESIRIIGLIEPIVLDDDNVLIAGLTRIRAHELLGRIEIEFVRKSQLTPWQSEFMQLEENIRRTDLTPVQEFLAKKRIHTMLQEEHGRKQTLTGQGRPNWTMQDTATFLGIAVGAVPEIVKIANAIEKNPDAFKDMTTKSQIKSAVARQEEFKIRTVLAAVAQQQHLDATPVQVDDKGHYITTGIDLYQGDSIDIIRTFPDDKFACLITDPPWNVEYDETFGSDWKTGLEVTRDVLKALYPKLRDGSLCWMFCGTKHLTRGTIRQIIIDCGYICSDQILIWYKPGSGRTSNPYTDIKANYEPCILFYKGRPRAFNAPIFAVQGGNLSGRKIHPAQKSTDFLERIIATSTVPGEYVIDPFMGSGQTLIAARNLHRKAVGIDKEKQWYDVAITEIANDWVYKTDAEVIGHITINTEDNPNDRSNG